MGLFRRRPRWVPKDNPWDRAMALAKEGDWRGLRFIEMTEHLAEIEGALVNAFEADDGQRLIGLVYAIEDAWKTKEVQASVPKASEDR